MGESISQVPYHFEHAMTLAEAIARSIIEADRHNAFLKSDAWTKQCANCGLLPGEHISNHHCPEYIPYIVPSAPAQTANQPSSAKA